MLPTDEKLDPRVKRTRGLILGAFESLLAEKNFESISVQDVTEKAQINRATFYAHFEDKYALLNYSITQMFRQEIHIHHPRARQERNIAGAFERRFGMADAPDWTNRH